MRSSLYTYCFTHCPLAFFANHTDLGVFGGVVGVDHYHTNQGMPCINGRPQEFEHQDAFTIATKAQFPGTRVLQYRITAAVPYAGIVHDAMLAHPDYFIHWHHAPNNNGSIALMPYAEHGTGGPANACDWPIIAAAYDFSQQVVQDWFLENIIKPVMVHGDGVWLDGCVAALRREGGARAPFTLPLTPPFLPPHPPTHSHTRALAPLQRRP
jgi:hypothetical protein